MNIILIGAQGSGKGTQAKLLEKHYGYKHVSTGEIYRKKLEAKDKVAQEMKHFSNKGDLIPDSLILELVEGQFNDTGNILDGIPRTLEQAHALDDKLEINLVIELALNDEVALERMKNRHRADDTPQAMKHRLEIYRETTEPLLEYYKPRHIVHKVDANRSINEILADLVKIIDSQIPGQ